MSRSAGTVFHPTRQRNQEIWSGFSWPALFFGVFWFAYKRMYGWAMLGVIAGILTVGLSWLVFPFFANELHRKHLLKRGYVGQGATASKGMVGIRPAL